MVSGNFIPTQFKFDIEITFILGHAFFIDRIEVQNPLYTLGIYVNGPIPYPPLSE